MRSTFSFLFLLVCATVMAQTEYVTKGPIPIGIKVYDYENDRPIDISTICDGFDSDGLPIDLILPDGAQIAIFFPTITKENAGDFILMRGTSSRRKIDNFNYEYKGKQVAYLGNRSYSGGQYDNFTIEQIWNKGVLKLPTATASLSWWTDEEPFSLNLFIENNEIDERELFIDSLMSTLFSPENRVPKSYEYWLNNGFTSELTEDGLPILPVLPQGIGILSFMTTAPEVTVTRNGEKVEYLREERGFGDEKSYFLNTDLPGTYVISLYNVNKKYGRTKFIYTLTIEYSFWRQGGYYMLAGLGVLILAFLFYRINAKRKLESTQLQKQLSDAELKAVRAQLNPHFLFNALNAIQNLVNQNDTERANDYIVKLSKLLRTVLAQSDEALHVLEKEVNLSRLYLELENMRSPFNFNIEVDSAVDMNALVPTMMLQPYLENAVIHGIQKKGATEVTLMVCQENDQLVLKVSDNGKNKNTTFNEGTGMALGRNKLDIIKKQSGDSVKAGIKVRASSENGFIVEIRLPADL